MGNFGKVSVIGPGLIGGSIALALKHKFPDLTLSLWGRREEVVDQARRMGLSGATTNLSGALLGADLVILATPVGVMSAIVDQMDLNRSVLVTDVGSVKRSVHSELGPRFKGKPADFIGSHPMAGSEKTGLSAATADLLECSACIITNDENAEECKVEKVEMFWTGLGMRTRRLCSEDHDYAVARISHFPHLLACVGANVGLAYQDLINLSGGGMRDTTRVAAGDPNLWKEIILENADALQRSLGESVRDLVKLREILENKDAEALMKYLTAAKQKRDQIK